jgi:uncharacterized surface protein with fasciclin (FAS1) repeats
MKFIRTKLFLVGLALLTLQCQKERDKYYEAPEWAGEPIYTMLEQEGRFDKYLRVVDKSMYLASFKGNGYWTVFAPNNAAMDEYLQKKGYSSVDDISEEEANRLVAYNMLYNKYVFDHLSSVLDGGWDTLQSIKKQTPYYEDLRRKPYRGSDSAWIVNPTGPFGFNTQQRNYKYLPFYLKKVFEGKKELNADYYKLFYPNTEYTGSNVQGAAILKTDIIAANGVVHEVNRVNEPLPNLEDILVERGSSDFSGGKSYSRFKNLIFDTKNDQEETYFIQYMQTPSIDDYFRRLYPSRGIDRVLIKIFTSFNTQINCERPDFEYGVETEGYTLLAPTNEAMNKFETEKLQPYGITFDSLSNSLKSNFIRAHMATNMVWPNQFYYSLNEAECFINGRKGVKGKGYNAVEQFPASNGLFYGVDDVIKSPYFETVFTEIQLRPDKYLYMYQALNMVATNLWTDLLKCQLNAYENEHYLVLLPTDDQLRQDGFTLGTNENGYYFTHRRTGGSNEAVANRLRRLVRSHVFKRYVESVPRGNDEISTQIDDFIGGDLDGYDGYSYAINDYGDVVRYKDNKLQMIGNYYTNFSPVTPNVPVVSEVVTATPIKSFLNGTVFEIDRLLAYASTRATAYAEDPVISYIEKMAQDNPNVGEAVKYLKLFAENDVQKDVLNNGQYWTILLPTDSAMIRAYAPNLSGTTSSGLTYNNTTSNLIDSLMPADNIRSGLVSTAPDQKRRAEAGLAKAINFFSYLVIPGIVYVDDGYKQVLLSSGLTRKEAVAATRYKHGLAKKSTLLEVDKIECKDNRLRFAPYKTPKSGTPECSIKENSVTVIRGVNRSNLFAPMGIIHEVDGLLRYKPEN